MGYCSLVGFSIFSLLGCGIRPLYVVSDSMVPTFYKGDVVFVSTNERVVNKAAVGNIVAFRPEWFPEDLVTHRIIKIDGDTMVTQGDGNANADVPSRVSDIEGVITSRIPYGGWFIHPKVTGVLLIITGVCSMAYTVLMSREKKKTTKQLLQRFYR